MLFRVYEKDFDDNGAPIVKRHELTMNEIIERVKDEHYQDGLTALVLVPDGLDCHEQALAVIKATF